jgi:hypothetical protein
MTNVVPRGSSSGRRMPVDRSTLIVWTVWVAMTAVALATLYRYGRNIPLAEDWQLVMPFTGHEPDILRWLWSQNNEHRVPVPRLIMLLLLWLSNGDFRSGMLFDILSLSMLAAAMMRTASLVRGKSSVSDAFFPLALLHLGHWENLFWTWQLSFVVSIELAALVLLVLVRRPALDTTLSFWTVTVALLLLPLCGATGLIFVPAFGAWTIWCVWSGRSHIKPVATWRRVGTLALVGAVALVYFVGYQRPDWNPPNPGLRASLQTALQFLALGWGPAVIGYWWSAVATTVILLGATGACLLLRLWHHRRERPFELGALTIVMSNSLLFTLLMGYGRAGQIQIDGKWPLRYVLLSALTLCAVYFVWLRCGTPHTRRAVPAVLALVVAVLVVPNASNGWRFFGEWYDAGMTSLEADIASGQPVETLAERHQVFLVHWLEPARVAEQIEMLKARGVSAFADPSQHRTSDR